MKKISETLSTYLNTEKVWKNLDFCLLGLIFMLSGIIFGFLLAPIKKGFKIGCGNIGNCYGCKQEEDEEY